MLQIEYVRIHVKDILPKLTKEDSLMSMSLKDIFELYEKPLIHTHLMDSTHRTIENYIKTDIVVYELLDGKIDHEKSRISISCKRFDQTINLVAKDPRAYEEVCCYTL